MADLSVVLIGTYVPRHDGLATFAADLTRAVTAESGVQVRVIAIDPEGETLHYGQRVVGRIEQGHRDSYLRAADMVTRLRPNIVCLQHEFGLWGVWGDGLEEDFAIPVIERVAAGGSGTRVVTTLHTIRPAPGPEEREVERAIVERSAATVVMARSGAMILLDDYGVDTDTIVRIPHGVPAVERRPRRYFKQRLSLVGRAIITTLGMLDRRKGIEYAIAAMPEVVASHPEALYLVVGETHPETRKHYGEQYRRELQQLVRELNLQDNVRFVNQYLTDAELVDYLQASDIYLSPYLDRHQITSGTLAFAVGTGKAIISTPYVHATEALAEGRGLLAEFRSAESLSNCMLLLLDDAGYRLELEQRTAEYGKQDSWPLVGASYADLFRRVVNGDSLEDMLAIEPEPLSVGNA